MTGPFYNHTPKEIKVRCLDMETCRKFGYGVSMGGQQIADYRDPETGALVAQKVRGPNKQFSIVGDGKDMPLFGQNLWKPGRRIVITEGEIDALSVAQATGLSWPVVSLPNGAQSAVKALQRSLQWLEAFESVVLCFDMDEPGREAAAECAQLFTPGKCHIAELSRKDAGEMLVAGEVKELSQALWNARVYRPDGIVTLDEIEARVLAEPETGRPWFLPGLSKATFGRRDGEVIAIGGGTGCGKTDFLTQQIAADLQAGIDTGVIFLEQSVGETGRRLAGKLAGRRFHVPDGSWTGAELQAAWGALKGAAGLHLYDSWGSASWEDIRARIRYLVLSLGCKHIWLDHLTALAAAEDDERKALERIMSEAAQDAQALRHTLHFVSHLATPEGKPHEEGGRVMVRHFKGSRAIGYWSHFMLGIERDTQKPGLPTTLRVLKDRFTGNANGMTFGMQYDRDTGLLSECALEEGPFKDETSSEF